MENNVSEVEFLSYCRHCGFCAVAETGSNNIIGKVMSSLVRHCEERSNLTQVQFMRLLPVSATAQNSQ